MIADGEHQRMAGVNHRGEGRTGLVERADGFSVKQTRS